MKINWPIVILAGFAAYVYFSQRQAQASEPLEEITVRDLGRRSV